MMNSISYVEIIPNLFLGNLSVVDNVEFVNSMSLIINLSMKPLINIINKEVSIMNIEIHDEPTENISKYFDKTYDAINDMLNDKNSKVLVYCKIGKSRSVSIIMNYLMTKYNMCYDLAFIEMLCKKSEIGANYGFVEQLKNHFEQRLKKENIYSEIILSNNERLKMIKNTLDEKINGKKTTEEWQALKKDREILRYLDNAFIIK